MKIVGYSILLYKWVLQYLLAHNQPEEAIREAERAVHVFCEFNDSGLFYNELSECCESIARAYASTENFESCLVYLEQAYAYADMQDKQETGFVYNVYGIMGETIETEEKLSAKRELARVLLSDERGEYNPIREEECFKKVIASCSG